MFFCKYVQARGSSNLKNTFLKKKVNTFQIGSLLDLSHAEQLPCNHPGHLVS